MNDLKLYIVKDFKKINNEEYLKTFKDYIKVIDVTNTVFPLPNIFYLNNFL